MNKKTKIILLLILLLGAFLRVYQLDRESIFRDELITISQSFNTLSDMARYNLTEGNFPLYFIIMHYWIKLFGAGEFAVRFPSAIFGIISIYIVFLLGKRLYDENVGLLASYLFAVSTINIFFSQWARPYSMATFFVSLSFLFLLKALEKNNKFLWLSYIVFTILALLAHITVFPIIICQILFIFLLHSNYKYISIKKLVFIFTLILIIYLPFSLRLIIATLKNSYFVPAFPPRTSLRLLFNIFNLFGGKIYLDSDFEGVMPTKIFTNLLGILLFFLCLIGIFSLFKFNNERISINNRKRQIINCIYLFLWLAIPIIPPFIFSILFIPIFGPVCYVLYISIAYYLLISKGILFFRKKLCFSLILFIIFMGSIFSKDYYYTEKGTNWRGICNYIKENIKQDEKTAFLLVNCPEYEFLSYYRAPDVIGIEFDEMIERATKDTILSIIPKDQIRTRIRELKLKVESYRLEELTYNGIWLTIWNIPSLSHLRSEIIKKLQNKYILVEEKDFYSTSLCHFRIRK